MPTMIALVCVRSLTLARVSTVRMEPHRANTFDLHTVALKNTTAALANAQQLLSNLGIWGLGQGLGFRRLGNNWPRPRDD